MTREQKLESMLMTLFTLAPNIKQEHWDKVYEQYKNLDTVTQQSLSSSEQSSSPKSDFNCKHCGTEWNHSDMIGTRRCPECQKSDF